ncbi:hypothetical protein JCM19233_1925 [Vibrio astriarenae]|nr:hypothetical protein JCM19233_1925 [Vibrio sp. C7]
MKSSKAGNLEENLTRSDQRRLRGLDTIQKIVKEKGGELISDGFTKYADKITIRCQHGHIWSPVANDVKNGHWCPVCGENQKYSTDRVKLFVKDQFKGKLIDLEFKGMPYMHTWKCSKGHIFEKKGRAVVFDKTWCPICSKEEKQRKIRENRYAELKALVEEKGGKMISKDFILSTIKLIVKCEHGHEFRKTSTELRKGHWCPDCERSARIAKILESGD